MLWIGWSFSGQSTPAVEQQVVTVVALDFDHRQLHLQLHRRLALEMVLDVVENERNHAAVLLVEQRLFAVEAVDHVLAQEERAGGVLVGAEQNEAEVGFGVDGVDLVRPTMSFLKYSKILKLFSLMKVFSKRIFSYFCFRGTFIITVSFFRLKGCDSMSAKFTFKKYRICDFPGEVVFFILSFNYAI